MTDLAALTAHVNADPRVVSARTALDLFDASPWGRRVDAAVGDRAAYEALPEEVKETAVAFIQNLHRARSAARREFLAG